MKIYRDVAHPWAALSKSHTTSLQKVYSHTSNEIERAFKKPVWIIDIDSTLLCLSLRARRILEDFVRFEWRGDHYSELLRSCVHMDASNHMYGIRPNIECVFGVIGVCPNKGFYREFENKFMPFWKQNFFNDRYLDQDFKYPGADTFCNEVSKLGARIVYLTGRHENSMRFGTIRTMKNLGFPVSQDQATFILKTDPLEADMVYKTRVLRHLNDAFHVVGFIDNEPENILAQIKQNKDSMNIWFHSISSERIPDLNRLSIKPQVLDTFVP